MRQLTFLQAINEALHQEMEKDERVVVLGEDVGKMGGDFGATRGLWQKFGPARVKDTPLSEAAILGAANGAAMVGLRPVAEIMFADFITECYDQIVNSASKVRYIYGGTIGVPVVVRTACGAGMRTGAQHSQSVEAWLMNVPGLTLVAPSTPHDVKGLLIASIRDDNPVIFLEHKMLYGLKGEVSEEPYTIPIGRGEIKKKGNDVTIITYMKMVHEALAAAQELEEEGISVEVVDLRTLIPLDKELVMESVHRTGRALVLYEAPRTGGFGAEVAALIAEEAFTHLKGPVRRLAGLDVPLPFSPVLEDYVIPNREDVCKEIKSLLA